MAADHPVPHDSDGGDYHRGDQIIDEQRSTYDVFMGLTKWGSLIVAAAVLWASVAFATAAGWVTALGVAGVFVVAGFFLLREKKSNEPPAH